MSKYYDGTKLLSMKDLNGETPELYISTSNRTAGKTTYFNRLAVRRFLKNKGQFCILYRFANEIKGASKKFFQDIKELFFPEMNMTEKKIDGSACLELQLDGKTCGYAVALNSADSVKRMSHLFNNVTMIIFDEFQSETSHYANNEIDKLLSIHTSIARGHGEQTRYVPIYMISNMVTIINPYYTALGISSRLRSDTHYMKGHGWVLEQAFYSSASEALKSSGIARAFSDESYIAYASENVYLNDNLAFIEKPTGKNQYVMTFRYNGKDFAVREYNDGIMYVSKNIDKTFNTRITADVTSHQSGYILLDRSDIIIKMRLCFKMGLFRFADLECKEALLKTISY